MKQQFSELSKVLTCVCTNAYQDKRYGPQQRVMNPTQKTEGNKQQFRCTVCGRLHTN